MINYICPECDYIELDFEIRPFCKCPKCKKPMNAEEE